MCDGREDCVSYSYTESTDEHCYLYFKAGNCSDETHVIKNPRFQTYIKSHAVLYQGVWSVRGIPLFSLISISRLPFISFYNSCFYRKGIQIFSSAKLKHSFELLDWKACDFPPTIEAYRTFDLKSCARKCDEKNACKAFQLDKEYCYILSKPRCGRGKLNKHKPPGPIPYVKKGHPFG